MSWAPRRGRGTPGGDCREVRSRGESVAGQRVLPVLSPCDPQPSLWLARCLGTGPQQVAISRRTLQVWPL